MIRTSLCTVLCFTVLVSSALTVDEARRREVQLRLQPVTWLPTWPWPAANSLGAGSLLLGSTPSPSDTFSLAGPIPPSCPAFPSINAPGVLCEDFDTERNGLQGFQWTRLPVAADPNDPLRAIGDPNDDVLGYTMTGGPTPMGTDARTCMDDAGGGFIGCQDAVSGENDWHLHSPFEGPGAGYDPLNRPGIGAPDGGKAHSGVRSMHWGRHTSAQSTLGDAIRFRQVSAFVLDSQGDPNLSGIVPGSASALEFWHMISVPDDENFGLGYLPAGTTFGGGQVQISLLGSDGKFGKWQRVTPTFNGYDSTIQDTVSLCSFDPGDDQLAPADETICASGPVWADLGDVIGTDASCATDTDGNDALHKDCGAISSCSGGPGCTENGSLGTGVWARSAFNLSPFAGRLARLRWIGMMDGGWSFGTSRSAMEPDMGPIYQMNDGDDGWWIDDIVLTDLRTAPSPCAPDADGDGYGICDGDCDDANPAVYPHAPQVCGDGLNNDCTDPRWPALAGTNELDDDGDGLTECQGDCDDTRASVYPGAPQICDGLNNDCIDPSWPKVPASEANADGDAFRICQGDCDDAHASVYPGAPQICDGLNNDCLSPSWPALAGTNEADDDGDGFSECQSDCDDALATVYPGAPQICDGLNNDCRSPSWPGVAGTNDGDDDGDGFSECQGDCDDTVAFSSPPSEARDLAFSGDDATMTWLPPLIGPAGYVVAYDVIRAGASASDFVVLASCLESDDGSDTQAIDTQTPAANHAFYYLVRAQNACGAGFAGRDSSGVPRPARNCP